jgi:hypothetical protein
LGNVIERDHLGDPDVDGTNIKMELQEAGFGGMGLFELTQVRDR